MNGKCWKKDLSSRSPLVTCRSEPFPRKRLAYTSDLILDFVLSDSTLRDDGDSFWD